MHPKWDSSEQMLGFHDHWLVNSIIYVLKANCYRPLIGQTRADWWIKILIKARYIQSFPLPAGAVADLTNVQYKHGSVTIRWSMGVLWLVNLKHCLDNIKTGNTITCFCCWRRRMVPSLPLTVVCAQTSLLCVLGSDVGFDGLLC